MIKKTEELTRHLDGQLHLKTNINEILNYAEMIFYQADEDLKANRISSELSQVKETLFRISKRFGDYMK